MPQFKPDTKRVSKQRSHDYRSNGDRASVARSALRTGCAFVGTNAALGGAAGKLGLDLVIVLCTLGGVWIVVVLTYLFVYFLMRQ
jgi:hypothetical protein